MQTVSATACRHYGSAGYNLSHPNIQLTFCNGGEMQPKTYWVHVYSNLEILLQMSFFSTLNTVSMVF